jgi:hypothetical protein
VPILSLKPTTDARNCRSKEHPVHNLMKRLWPCVAAASMLAAPHAAPAQGTGAAYELFGGFYGEGYRVEDRRRPPLPFEAVQPRPNRYQAPYMRRGEYRANYRANYSATIRP